MIGERYIIWIRHPKTAGTSIRGYLLNPNQPIVENKPNVIYTYDGEYITQLTTWFGFTSNKIDKNKVISLHTRHIPEFKKKYPNIWNESFKFSVSRNPYDRFVSSWKYLKPTNNLEFSLMRNFDYTKLNIHDHYHIHAPQTMNLIDNGNYISDYTVKFENLNNDFNELLDILKIPKVSNLLKTRQTDRKEYDYYYENNNHMKEYVYNTFENDFIYLNYKK